MNTSIEARTTINSINIKHHVCLQAHVVLFLQLALHFGAGGLACSLSFSGLWGKRSEHYCH